MGHKLTGGQVVLHVKLHNHTQNRRLGAHDQVPSDQLNVLY